MFSYLVLALFDAVLGGADVVEDGHDAGLGFLVLDQLANDGVVEVVDGAPRNSLLDIFFLKVEIAKSVVVLLSWSINITSSFLNF